VAAGFDTLADEIVRAEIQRSTRADGAADLNPHLRAGFPDGRDGISSWDSSRELNDRRPRVECDRKGLVIPSEQDVHRKGTVGRGLGLRHPLANKIRRRVQARPDCPETSGV
jgi:hypothetical protein